MKVQGLAVAALSLLAAVVARAEEPTFQFLPEPVFQTIVVKAVQPLQTHDAFAGLAQCAVADARTFVPVTAEQAQKMLAPCIQAVATRYQQPVRIEALASARSDGMNAQIEGLAVYVPEQLGVMSPLMRDLEHSLSTRNGRILGQTVVIRRDSASAGEPAATSTLQQAIDRCYTTDIVRQIATSEDFIASYGRCIVTDPSLRVSDIRPSVSRALGVTVQSQADPDVVRALNGSVRVLGASGPVTLSVTAYPSSAMTLP